MSERKSSQTSQSAAANKSPNLSVRNHDEEVSTTTTTTPPTTKTAESSYSSHKTVGQNGGGKKSKNDMIVIKQTDDEAKKQTIMKKIKLLRGGHTTYDVHPNPKLAATSASNNNTSSTNSDNQLLQQQQQFNDMPKKKSRILGMPLICCTYFAAIYSLLAYGATSLLSIIELMMNNSTIMLPLYLLLVGYLLITLLSFLLIVAIQRESLNIILFWIISLSVFILPEIGLNIVLAENHYKWFQTPQGLYTLVCLVIRVTIDLFCLGIILYFHVNRTRRQRYLRAMLKPIKKKIISGQSLQAYHDIKAATEASTNSSSHIVAAAAGVSATNTLSMAIGHQPATALSNTGKLDDAKLISIHYPVIDAMPVPSLSGGGNGGGKASAGTKQSQTPMAIGFNLLEKGGSGGETSGHTDKSRNIEIIKPGQENDFKTATRSTLAMPTLNMPITKVIQPNPVMADSSNPRLEAQQPPATTTTSVYVKPPPETGNNLTNSSSYYFDTGVKSINETNVKSSSGNSQQQATGVASVRNNQYFITDEQQIPQLSATAHFCPFHHHYHPLYNQLASSQHQQQQQPQDNMSSALHLIWNGETGEYVPYNSQSHHHHHHQTRRANDYSKMMVIGQNAELRRNNNNYGHHQHHNLIRTKSTDLELGGGSNNRNTTRSPFDFRVSFAQQPDVIDDNDDEQRYNRGVSQQQRNYDMVPIEFRRAKRTAQQKQQVPTLTHQYSLNPDYLYNERVIDTGGEDTSGGGRLLSYSSRLATPQMLHHGSQPGLYNYVLGQPNSRQVYLPPSTSQQHYVNYYVDHDDTRYAAATNRQQGRIYSEQRGNNSNNYDFGYGFNSNYAYQTANKNSNNHNNTSSSFNLSLNNLHRLNNDQSGGGSSSNLPVVSDEQPSATVWKGSACNCINIASCSQDNLNEFLHSKDCIFFQQPLAVTKSSMNASSITRLNDSNTLEPTENANNSRRYHHGGRSHHRGGGGHGHASYYAFAKNRSLEPNYMKLKSFSHSDYDIPRESVKLV